MKFGKRPMAESIAEVRAEGKRKGLVKGGLRACLSQVSALPLAAKGEVMIAILSLPAPVAGASLEAFCLMRSIPLPLVRERHTRSAGPFAIRACGRHVFGSALPYAKHSPAFGARTGRALQNCCARPKGKAIVDPLAQSLRGVGAFGQGECHLIGGGTPKTPRQWPSRWIAHAPRANRFAVRAPVRAPKAEECFA